MAIGVSGIDFVSDVVNNLPNIFLKDAVRLWNRRALVASRAVKKIGASPAIHWTVSNGSSGVAQRGEGYSITPATDANQDDRVALTLNRGIYTDTFAFTDRELALLQTYDPFNPNVVGDLMKERLREAYLESLAKMARQIEIDVLTGTGSRNDPSSVSQNSIVGFVNALAASGTYAGASFSSTTNTGLVASVQSGVGNVSRSVMDNLLASILQASQMTPDFIMASPKTCTYLKAIADNQIRYNDNFPHREIGGLNGVAQDGGSVMSYCGIPVFSNSAWGVNSLSAPGAGGDGYVVFGQWDKMKLDILRYDPAQDALLSKMRELQSANGEGSVGVGLPARSWAQAKTAASLCSTQELEVGFAILQPNAFGILSGVTGASTN